MPSPPSSSPLRRFLDTEAAGGVVLLGATVIALVWANSPWQESYRQLWSTDLVVRLGAHRLGMSLHDWVNDGLMAIFFLVVGLEIRRELAHGELRDRRQAAVPAIAALGGMAVPALVYLAVNAGGVGQRGWGIPMATDIAFALGVVALLGPRVPAPLKVFLLTLAIVDDIGAIVVIAVFYSSGISWLSLAIAAALLVLVVVMQRLGVGWTPAYAIVGAAVWLAVHESGVHATLAGVALGLLAPTEPALHRDVVTARHDELVDVSTPRAARTTVQIARGSVSHVEWLEYLLHPWSSFLIVPVFALANAGIPLGAHALGDAATSRITIGVVAGLVLGKLVGISAGTWLAVRWRVGRLPPGIGWGQVVGIALVAGVGFTVSLFLTDLAFASSLLEDQARIGILAASLIAAGAGAAVLAANRR